MYDVIVIGGGASGMMAAGRAAELGLKVLLLEKNRRLGEKLRISGGGRCNITNNEENERLLLAKYGSSEKFLYGLFAQFGVKSTFSFFESRGLPLVTEARKRVFPKSQNAVDVVRVLERYLLTGSVEVITHANVTKINAQDSMITGVLCADKVYSAKKYIIATGGMSRPETGSSGDGFEWLKQLGHSVVNPSPSIVPLKVLQQWVKDLAGITLADMLITFYLEGAKQFRLHGDVLFTHFGISGPLILNNANKVSDLLQSGIVSATIDAFPHEDLGTLQKRIIIVFDANKNKAFKNVISDFAPAGMQKGLVALLSKIIDPDTKVHSVSRLQRTQLVQTLKALPLTIEGLMGFDKAVVADGGVPLTQVDMRTTRSKIIKNLYITGDLLHINRPSGGYSLQLCWSSGYVAGTSAARASLV